MADKEKRKKFSLSKKFKSFSHHKKGDEVQSPTTGGPATTPAREPMNIPPPADLYEAVVIPEEKKHPKNDPFSPSGHGIDISDEDVVPRNTKADSHCVPQTISPPDFSSASSTLDFNPSKESRLRSNEYTNEPPLQSFPRKPDLEIPPRPSASQIPTNSNPSKVENVTQPTSNSHWVIVSSILEEESPANLRFKVNDFLFWLDYDPGYISRGSLSLTPGKFLECLTWAGDSVVVPSACVRLPKSDYELAQGLSRQPRASALTDYTAKSREELSVKAGEVVYLFKKLDDDYYLVMNKSNMRGKLPKDILSILLAPT